MLNLNSMKQERIYNVQLIKLLKTHRHVYILFPHLLRLYSILHSIWIKNKLVYDPFYKPFGNFFYFFVINK